MPIKIPHTLPALNILQNEGVQVISSADAFRQDIRPMRIAILNIMPEKIATETQLLRLLGSSPLQVELTLIHPGSHVSKNTDQEHLQKFYKAFSDVKDSYFDGLIVTGAPLGTLEFDQVNYWDEMQSVLDWSRSNVFSTLHICWGALAGLFHHYGIQKHLMEKKLTGVFKHGHLTKNELFGGFDDQFNVPHSRYTEIRQAEIEEVPELTVLSTSKEAGVYMVMAHNNRQVFITGHPEYDAGTLDEEYRRDLERGVRATTPINYYRGDDPNNPPTVTWKSHGHLLFSNWLNGVYQNTTPDVGDIPAL